MNHIIKKDSILGETLDSFESKISDAGFAKYRATQVFEWIYKKRVNDWELMHNIPKDLKEWLDEKYEINASKIVLSKSSNDVTQKYLIQLKDKQMIETVLISAPQEGVGIENPEERFAFQFRLDVLMVVDFVLLDYLDLNEIWKLVRSLPNCFICQKGKVILYIRKKKIC